jgi:molybdenum cofactor cytidylyltransferase
VSDLWGILLAAGSAERFRGAKLLHPLEGGVPMAVLAARHLLHALPNSVAVVRPGDDELKTQLAAEGIGIVVNPRPDDGMGASLACAVAATDRATGWVIALADMPWIASSTIRGVARLLYAGAAIAAPVHQGQRGHPVGFSHSFHDELLALSGDEGARGLLVKHAPLVQLFEVDDPGCLLDVDHPDDLALAPNPTSPPFGKGGKSGSSSERT